MEDDALAEEKTQRKVVVDLETGLLYPGLVWEAIWCWARLHPLKAFLLPIYLLRGYIPSEVRNVIASRKLYPALRNDTVAALKSLKAEGASLCLVHDDKQALAESISLRLGIFDQVSRSVPKEPYAYITTAGNPVHWQDASEAIIFGEPADYTQRYKIKVAVMPKENQSRFSLLVRAIRLHQWAKSTLVFMPIVLAHRAMEWNTWLVGLAAFLCFGLVSSSIYVMNDLLDIEADRQHPVKKKRPFASGEMPLYWGGILYVLLLSVGLWGGYLVSSSVAIALVGYAISNLVYTIKLKSIPIIDTFVLTSMYIWRLATGAIAVGVSLSGWVYMFCGFFFFSLAQIKRVSELLLLKEIGDDPRENGRGYEYRDVPLLTLFGVASAFMSSGILAIYMDSEGKSQSFNLWVMNVISLYWLCRMWLLTWRGKMASDPVKFALRDLTSISILIGVVGLWFL